MFFTAGLLPWVAAAAQPAAAPSPAPAVAAVDAPTRTVTLSFRDLGLYGPAELRGLEGVTTVPIGIRQDQIVVAAKLRLRYMYSPALLPDLSHIRVRLNEEAQGVVPLPKEQAGREVETELALDPRYFSDYNSLRFDFIGHYSRDCEDEHHSSLWASISERSVLELTVRQLDLRRDLALLPAPFFDYRDNRRVVVPLVLPAKPDVAVIRSAGVVASWFGALADYRGARFPVSMDGAPHGNALIFATNTQQPAGFHFDPVDKPTLRLLDDPADPSAERLLLMGRDDEQLAQAAEALVHGDAVLTGPAATVVAIHPDERRAAYDAPRWLRTDRKVRFAELVESIDELQAVGISPPVLRVNLRLPPDLSSWTNGGVPVDLRFRYSAPAERDNSTLSIGINEHFIRAFHLRPEAQEGDVNHVLVPLLGDTAVQGQGELMIPAFQLGSNNQMQFQFAIESHKRNLCTDALSSIAREAIDGDSTIDLSGYFHYAAMPDLALFANAGFPFTKFADLATTAIVLPENPDRGDLEELYFLLGQMGRSTGIAATRFQLIFPADVDKAADADLLVLGGHGDSALLSRWGKNLSLILGPDSRRLTASERARLLLPGEIRREKPASHGRDLTVSAPGSLAALMGFESPLKSGRSVIALAATDSAAQSALLTALEDNGRVKYVRGDLAIVRGDEVQSFRGEPVYYVGELSWWLRIWYVLSRHPVLVLLITILAVMILASALFGFMRRVSHSRTN